MNTKSEGFTIIELLVVVAIIAVLAAIVAANVVNYINRTKNTTVMEDMDAFSKNAAIYFAGSGNFQNLSTDPSFINATTQVSNLLGVGNSTVLFECGGNCLTNPANSWCYCANLLGASNIPAGSTYCTDYLGYKKITTTACNVRCYSSAVTAFCTD